MRVGGGGRSGGGEKVRGQSRKEGDNERNEEVLDAGLATCAMHSRALRHVHPSLDSAHLLFPTGPACSCRRGVPGLHL